MQFSLATDVFSCSAHTILNSGRLFRQFVVDAYTTIESNRLRYLRTHQTTLRYDSYDSIKQSENAGRIDMAEQGSSFLLPATFTGGPRYMKNLYLDATTIYMFLRLKDHGEFLSSLFIIGLLSSDHEKKKFALLEIEKILKRCGTSLAKYPSMPQVAKTHSKDSNVLILDERSYDREALLETLDRDIPNMTPEQRKIYDEILDAVNKERAIRSRGDITLNVASSGIASLLLQGGKTAHSRFGVPLNPDEFSSCTMAHGSDQANLVKEASLITWDEAPIMSRYCFEALDRSLTDIIRKQSDKPFGEEMIYLSADSIDPTDTKAVNDEALDSDFLNNIKVSGLPSHRLRLKVGCPVMVLRNVDPPEGLMNGTRLQITQLMEFMVAAKIITGSNVGKTVYIPRLLITPSDTRLPFKMRRRQLPLAVAFAITINKSQGQSLSEVGLFLPRPVFSHGQLYVAISRFTSKKGLEILIVDKDGKPQHKTVNVVFKEVFNNL
uniref:ATP-dependent DNA helicase n=1 Tax=Brassica oleracea var. oleracea TaxID=109376 RepID=A0A0D3CQY9_BRAOL